MKAPLLMLAPHNSRCLLWLLQPLLLLLLMGSPPPLMLPLPLMLLVVQ
jgi:hypothetical protein